VAQGCSVIFTYSLVP